MNAIVPVALGLAAITGLALWRRGRKRAPLCRCGYCGTGLPCDGDPLEDWEWQQVRYMEACYRDTAHDPMAGRNAPRRGRWALFPRR